MPWYAIALTILMILAFGALSLALDSDEDARKKRAWPYGGRYPGAIDPRNVDQPDPPIVEPRGVSNGD